MNNPRKKTDASETTAKNGTEVNLSVIVKIYDIYHK
jgi:hypothetical protein